MFGANTGPPPGGAHDGYRINRFLEANTQTTEEKRSGNRRTASARRFHHQKAQG
jgi:hypothetical protein